MKKLIFMITLFMIPFTVMATDLKINKLTVNGSEVSLVNDEYSAKVDYELTSADITVTVNDGINYEIVGNSNFVVGSNVVKINLSSNGETRTYNLNILRMADDVITLSNNNKLNNLSITGYPIGFDSGKLEYNLTIKAEAKLKISYEADDENATVFIEGNEGLVDGSVIKIKVVAQSGDVREYKINIKATEKREELEVI